MINGCAITRDRRRIVLKESARRGQAPYIHKQVLVYGVCPIWSSGLAGQTGYACQMSRKYRPRTIESLIYDLIDQQDRGEVPEIKFEIDHGRECDEILIQAFGDLFLDNDDYPDEEDCSIYLCENKSTRLEIHIGGTSASRLCRSHLAEWLDRELEKPECDDCAVWLDSFGSEE